MTCLSRATSWLNRRRTRRLRKSDPLGLIALERIASL